jgi:hypothetical protein
VTGAGSTRTSEPVERFERYAHRKEQTRRITAIAAVSAIAVATFVGGRAVLNRDTQVPIISEPTPTQSATPSATESTSAATGFPTVTATLTPDGRCEGSFSEAHFPPGTFQFTYVNETDGSVAFWLFRVDPDIRRGQLERQLAQVARRVEEEVTDPTVSGTGEEMLAGLEAGVYHQHVTIAHDTDTILIDLPDVTNYVVVCGDRVGALWRPLGFVGFIKIR